MHRFTRFQQLLRELAREPRPTYAECRPRTLALAPLRLVCRPARRTGGGAQ